MMVEQRIEGFPDIVCTIGAASVVDHRALILDTDESQLYTIKVGEFFFVTEDSEGFNIGLLPRT